MSLKNKNPKVSLAIINKNDVIGARYVIPKIKRELFFEIFSVDGGSTDESIEFFKSENINTVVVNAGGRGGAMRHAAQICKGDYIVYLSTDGEEDANDLGKFIELFKNGADMVIASRTAKGAYHKAKSKITYYHRFLFLKFITKLINIFFKGNLTDCWNGYRGFNIKKLKSVDIDAKDFMIEAQQTIRFLKRKYKIFEFPTHEGNRIAGQSSNPIFKSGIGHLWMLFD
ncbi:MAG: glycosyltransferase family 2 protein, partial [Rickettsiales bacterium]